MLGVLGQWMRKWMRIGKEADLRVLKAQLDLAAASVWETRITSPLWSLLVALLCSDLLVVFGNHALKLALLLPCIVAVATGFSAWLAKLYLRSGTGSPQELQIWFHRLIGVQAAISAAWGLMPWLLWQPHNLANHLFLAACGIAVISGMVAARGSNMAMFVASLLPISLLTTLRFAFADLPIDFAISLAAPLFSLQMWLTGRPLVARMQEDTRLRFQVGDMARELKQTRDEALKKRFEAETANASKTAFLANMSHELRTPLNAILGFSEIISQECFGPVGSARYKEYSADIHASGSHLLSLINDLLDIAKIEAGRMEISPHPLDARRSFGVALKLIAAKANEKHQRLSIKVDPGAPPLYADERALKQMLINLVSNAVKFTPEGGHIEVLASAGEDGGFQILVRDNGPGIAPEKLCAIFAPFNQVDNRYDRQAGGTGLGLALVRGLAELHGGRTWIESDVDAGCCAYVLLPVRPPEAAHAAA